tara:strand:+ start:2707 stop:3531 length:825 start_codon:yes stop_codon:yes gene_type:complete
MNLTDLGIYIDQNKPEDFITVYLTCLAQGFSLQCPIDNNQDRLTEKWSKILAKYRREFSDEFCKEIVIKWLKLLSQCDTSAPDVEMQIVAAAGISMADINQVSLQSSVEKSKKTVASDIPTPIQPSQDPLTKPEISSSYRERQLAEQVSLPEVQRLLSVYSKAFKNNDPDQFLISHLTFSKYGQAKEVPKSTVPQNIRASWESIIAQEFKTIASDEFLVSLTNEWFYLVNQKGLPMNAQDQEEILMTFLAKKNRPSKKVSQNSPSLFKKLFGSN